MSVDDHTVSDPSSSPPESSPDTVTDLDTVIDLTGGTLERVIDLRQPGAPYTYPSSPPADAGRYEDDPNATERGRRGVAYGSAEVRSAPPGT